MYDVKIEISVKVYMTEGGDELADEDQEPISREAVIAFNGNPDNYEGPRAYSGLAAQLLQDAVSERIDKFRPF